MRHTLLYALSGVLTLFLASEAFASLPQLPSPSDAPGIAGDRGETMVARRKKKKKKKTTRKTKSAPEAAENPPADGTDDAKTKDGAAAGAGKDADWGSSEWASPGWAGSGSGSSSSSSGTLLDDPAKKSEDGEAATLEAKEAKRSGYRRVPGARGAFLLLSPTYTAAGRNFQYSNSQTGNLRPYEAAFVSLVGVRAELYPGVLLETSGLDILGLGVSYAQAIGLKSTPKTDEGTEFSTTWNEIEFGATGRFHFSDLTLALVVSYGMLNFGIDVPADNALADEVQSIGYGFVRIGMDLRYTLSDLSLRVGGGYRHVLSTGELGDSTFPDSSALGFDVFGGVAYQILPFVEVYVHGKYVNFSHSFEPNATYAADGATDVYYGGELGATVFF